MHKKTLLWHDYETFGIDPQLSNVAQFAAIRTDEDLNIIDEPINIICRPTLDRLPSPEACMVTGISPLENRKKGLNEVSFFQIINDEFLKPDTCGVGYNNINFDDEVTRNGFYRNFFDPYKREWASGCSRWDLINVLRMVAAIKPDTFIVPIDKETGNKIFKLEELSKANGIIHEQAHDALSDVYATIGMAKIVKEKEPELYEELFNRRTKKAVSDFIFEPKANKFSKNQLLHKPIIMSDSYFGGANNFIEILFPIYTKDTDVYCLKLTKDLSKILDMDSNDLINELYKKKEELEDGEDRLPIHKFKINKCPVMLPISAMSKESAENLGISGDFLRGNLSLIKDNFELIKDKFSNMFEVGKDYLDSNEDVDQKIYSGFFGDSDKFHLEKIKMTESIYLLDYLEKNKDNFIDERLSEMLFRYTCRNFEDALDQENIDKWNSFCKQRILEGKYSLTFDQYNEEISRLKEVHKGDKVKEKILKDLEIFGQKTYEKIMK